MKAEVPFLSHHGRDTYHHTALPLLVVTLIAWLRYYLSGFSTSTAHHTFPHCLLWTEVSMYSAHFRTRTVNRRWAGFPLPGIWTWDRGASQPPGVAWIGCNRGGWLSPALFMKNSGRKKSWSARDRERGRGWEELPCLWSSQYFVPVPWRTQRYFLPLGSVRY